MQRLHSIVGILLFTALTQQAALAQGNEKRKTVLDGVFTAAQAERGKEAYATHCSTCHMEDLGGLSAPALKGEQFIDNWREDSVRSLFTFIRTQMPQRAAGSLEEKMYVDILAHILSVNMFPSGSSELSADALGSSTSSSRSNSAASGIASPAVREPAIPADRITISRRTSPSCGNNAARDAASSTSLV